MKKKPQDDVSDGDGSATANTQPSDNSHTTQTIDALKGKKSWLKLSFSKAAADRVKLDDFFHPTNKSKIDPDDYVLIRKDTYFDPALDKATAYLEDEDEIAHAVALSYRMNPPQNPPKNGHDFSEIGTVLTDIKGFEIGALCIAACTLKEWWEAAPNRLFIANIKDDNTSSIRTFQKLGWDPLHDPKLAQEIGEACDQSLDDPSQAFIHKSQSTNPDDAETWYVMTPVSLCIQAQILIHFMDDGYLFNKRTGETIDLDLGALDDIGLTRPRLEYLAQGQLNKSILMQVNAKNGFSGPLSPPPSP
ncbi:MAG: hypothetical protein QF692_08400 [Alphaproteobacteria bacterium]|jgi:hypothetical protein|nr:hypothetical protein [Alphaproteobacteria bacterium]MDP7223265.1 hypothetical protein [Alphaproteobacteria bacterium]